LVSDEVLDSYQSTGTKLAAPAKAPERGFRNSKTSAERVYKGNGTKKAPSKTPQTIDTPRVLATPPKDLRKERLYLLIENPEDTDTLTAIRRLADLNLGFQDVVLVLKEGETKRPLKMPFKVDASDDLITKMKELLGEDNVKKC